MLMVWPDQSENIVVPEAVVEIGRHRAHLAHLDVIASLWLSASLPLASRVVSVLMVNSAVHPDRYVSYRSCKYHP